ncbi:hypothetical protein C7W93_03365 [Glaciimonas sp. PCH181]|nr:hypothetical protein C7W93_03365 [Glaciimonas sp. PCH181]
MATGGVRPRTKSVYVFVAMLALSGAVLTGTAYAQEAAKPAETSSVTLDNKQPETLDAQQEIKQPAKPTETVAASASASIDPNTLLDASIPAADFVAHHPAGSVTSVVGADAVLTDITKARADVELRSLNEQRICYKKFFTNRCLNAAKEQRRLALKQIRPLEVEANAFKRRATADDRDKALADQAAKEGIAAPKREQDQKDKEITTARKVKEGNEKAAAVETNTKLHAGEAEKRVTDNAQKLQRIQQTETAKAAERAANRAAFIKKGQDATARQRDVAEKKAEKERQLAEKKAATPPASSTPAQP